MSLLAGVHESLKKQGSSISTKIYGAPDPVEPAQPCPPRATGAESLLPRLGSALAQYAALFVGTAEYQLDQSFSTATATATEGLNQAMKHADTAPVSNTEQVQAPVPPKQPPLATDPNQDKAQSSAQADQQMPSVVPSDAVKPEAAIVSEGVTGTKAQTPGATAETPAAKAQTPAATAETPAAKAQTPAATVEDPTATAETPAATAGAPPPAIQIPAQQPTPAAETPAGPAQTPTPMAGTPAAMAQTPAPAENPAATAWTPANTAQTPPVTNPTPLANNHSPAAEEPLMQMPERIVPTQVGPVAEATPVVPADTSSHPLQGSGKAAGPVATSMHKAAHDVLQVRRSEVPDPLEARHGNGLDMCALQVTAHSLSLLHHLMCMSHSACLCAPAMKWHCSDYVHVYWSVIVFE